MNILVTGGAGYIGSIITERLLGEDHQVIVLDNLQQGHREAVLPEAEFHLADIRDAQAVEDVFRHAKIEAVMHLAADTVVEYSVTDPKRYFQNNVTGGINLLEVMLKHDVNKFIFSSSAAIYGQPHNTRVSEHHVKAPINSYGESKLMFERVLDWYGKTYGLKHISLRCFNVAGASVRLGEDHRPETHLIPSVLKAAWDRNWPVAVFGTDYPTNDGSCIRDYAHVIDIAQGHILALGRVEELNGKVYNLGNGEGQSVFDVVTAARRVTKQNIPVRICPRRPGDPAVLVANSRSAKSELGWKPEFPDLESIIDSAWRWTKQHPNGYGY
jgi:UDP-glucose 4-epimerase